MKQVHLYISGSVQGVSYRYFVKLNADKLRVKGWVWNLSDGRVEAVLQGKEKVLKQLILLAKKGPGFAKVEDILVKDEDIKDIYTEFVIRY